MHPQRARTAVEADYLLRRQHPRFAEPRSRPAPDQAGPAAGAESVRGARLCVRAGRAPDRPKLHRDDSILEVREASGRPNPSGSARIARHRRYRRWRAARGRRRWCEVESRRCRGNPCRFHAVGTEFVKINLLIEIRVFRRTLRADNGCNRSRNCRPSTQCCRRRWRSSTRGTTWAVPARGHFENVRGNLPSRSRRARQQHTFPEKRRVEIHRHGSAWALAALGSKITFVLAGSSADRITTSVGCCCGGWFIANNIPARNCRSVRGGAGGNQFLQALFDGGARGRVMRAAFWAALHCLTAGSAGLQPTVVVSDGDALIFVTDGVPCRSFGAEAICAKAENLEAEK